VQESLSLDRPARKIAYAAMLLKLGNVASQGLPPLDLTLVIL
jgi:hypothetical protein